MYCTHLTRTQTKQIEKSKKKKNQIKYEKEEKKGRTEPSLGLATIRWDQALKSINK